MPTRNWLMLTRSTTQYGNAKVIRKRDQLATKNLKFPEEQFREFAEAITVFWKSLPEGLSYSGMGKEPKWFGKAYEKVKCDKRKTRA